MREKVLNHIASHLGGLIHNLNTPLMWIMGRSQLLMQRNEGLNSNKNMPDDEMAKYKEKTLKDLESINQGAEKIDHILKNLSYKMQMATEGYTAIEIREYLTNEMNYMLADMRFKHETKLEMNIDESRSFYTKLDYNVLSWAIISAIDLIISHTTKGRTIRIGFSGGVISINCPEIALTDDIKSDIEEACAGLKEYAAVSVCDASGLSIRLVLKGD